LTRMCGIAGFFSTKGDGAADLSLLRRMTRALDHRGPDGLGFYVDNRAGLGHARLSIIDLATGAQPMHNEDESLWIVFNGEIYNYVELRRELAKKGHSFYTQSDTEVVLHQFEEDGPDCVHRLNGQFAFAIFDSRKKSLFLARDRLGILPLVHAQIHGLFLFASEIKAIFQHDGMHRLIDPIALDQIFTFWAPLPGKTAFQDVHELPPGCHMTVSEAGIRVRKYWDIPFSPPGQHRRESSENLAEAVRGILMDAVRIRLRADVEVGTYLSGGLDSSGITSLVARYFNRDVQTFGIRFEESAFDESGPQQAAVSFLGTRHHDFVATDRAIGETLRDVVLHCEKPVLRTAPAPLFLLSEKVRQNRIKVVLTGEGADELFGGYNIFRETKIRAFWSKFPESLVRPRLVRRLYPYLFKGAQHTAFLTAFFGRDLEDTGNPFYSHLIRWRNTSRIKQFFSGDVRSQVVGYDALEDLKGRLPPEYFGWDAFSRAQYLESCLFMSNYLLSSQGDRMAMAHSVELRPPFLDHRLWEFMGTVPPHRKMPGLEGKFLLKRCLRGDLPGGILAREKHPYRAPIRQSLLDPAVAERTAELLSEGSVRDAGLFDPGKVGKILKKIAGAARSNETDDMALVGVATSQMLHREFIGNFTKARDDDRDRPVIDRRTECAPCR
jgi:asparagine synthase (glutamine-hydrolysing)